jgi:uncharacterized protein (DUF302 family)
LIRRELKMANVIFGVEAASGGGRAIICHQALPMPARRLSGRLVVSQALARGTTDVEGKSGEVGGQFGYNWQVNNVVFGFEIDLQWTDVKTGAAVALTTGNGFAPFKGAANSKLDWFGTTRARIGFLAARHIFFLMALLSHQDAQSQWLRTGRQFRSDQTFQEKMTRLASAFAVILLFTLFTGKPAMAGDGLITTRSSFGPEETMTRLETEVRAKGMTIFAHVDHAAGAKAAGMQLRPTDLLIFGAAKGGTPLMQAEQTIGIDLPLKALVWQDEAGTTFLSYNDPAYAAQRHGLGAATGSAIEAMSGALKAIALKVTSKP